MRLMPFSKIPINVQDMMKNISSLKDLYLIRTRKRKAELLHMEKHIVSNIQTRIIMISGMNIIMNMM